jgi:predicted metal-dependent hydrolase
MTPSYQFFMIAQKAYLELYPDAKLGDYEFDLYYSGKFNDYNANIKIRGRHFRINLSSKWRNINEDIKIGLIQVLLNKILRTNVQTQNIDLYELFLKKVHITVLKQMSDPQLSESFDRVNEKYFFSIIEKPNLQWGKESVRKLGSYEYGSDTITISKILLNADNVLLDYIMYHEMLHKKHKFYTNNGRSFHHTKEFRDSEKKFENYESIEQMLKKFLRNARFMRKMSWFYK